MHGRRVTEALAIFYLTMLVSKAFIIYYRYARRCILLGLPPISRNYFRPAAREGALIFIRPLCSAAADKTY